MYGSLRAKTSAVSRIRHRMIGIARHGNSDELSSMSATALPTAMRSLLTVDGTLCVYETSVFERPGSLPWMPMTSSTRLYLGLSQNHSYSMSSLGSIRSFHQSATIHSTASDEKGPPTEIPAPTENSEPIEYSTPELTRDAAQHKAGLSDPDLPTWQNPLHHNNEEMSKIFREDFDSQEAFEAAVLPVPPLGDVAPAYISEMAEEIVNLTLLEMNELVNKIAQHYGFHEGMLSPDDVGGGGDGADDDDEGNAEAAPAKTTFDVKLVSFDDKSKIKVIKEIRAIAGLGLKEAKEMVEGAPKIVLKQIKQEQADEIKAKLEELGAVIEIV
jgi:large subunit ribosomal protein L7/L12